MQLHFQPDYFEAALLQIVNVAAQLFVIHFERLLDFLLEVRRGLRDNVERRNVELLVVADGGVLE